LYVNEGVVEITRITLTHKERETQCVSLRRHQPEAFGGDVLNVGRQQPHYNRKQSETIGIAGAVPDGTLSSASGRLLRFALLGAFRLVAQPVEIGGKGEQGFAIGRRAGCAGSQAQLIGAPVIIFGTS